MFALYLKRKDSISTIAKWAKENLQDGVIGILILHHPRNRTLTITLTEKELTQKDKLHMLKYAVDSITSQRPTATHIKKRFE